MKKENDREKKLVLLNIDDKDLSELFTGLSELFTKKRSKTSPHITLRGPYITNPSQSVLKKMQETLIEEKIPLNISDVGMFDNDGLYFVYFKVSQKNIAKNSWKKDYPRSKYGFNPHITIYKGRDKELASRILQFLKNEKLSFTCNNYSLSFHELNTKQSKIDYQTKIRNANDVLNHYDNKYTYLLQKALLIA